MEKLSKVEPGPESKLTFGAWCLGTVSKENAAGNAKLQGGTCYQRSAYVLTASTLLGAVAALVSLGIAGNWAKSPVVNESRNTPIEVRLLYFTAFR